MSEFKELLKVWKKWEKRTGKKLGELHLFSDCSGYFEESTYGDRHPFNSLEELISKLKAMNGGAK